MFPHPTRSLLKILFVLCVVVVLIKPTIATLNIAFLYFNPDSTQSNFSTLKKSVDQFFKQSGMIIPSQAFSQKVDFDLELQGKRPALALVPNWYYSHYGKALGLKPLLTALNDGKTSYTKSLLVRSSDKFSLNDLKNKTIAMTSMGPDTEGRFAKLFSESSGANLSESNVIITPKDIDALYALVLGQVDAALVGKDSLEAVGKVNNKINNMVKELAISEAFPMPLLCVAGDNFTEKELVKIKKIFMGDNNKRTYRTFMQMLNIDGWKIILE